MQDKGGGFHSENTRADGNAGTDSGNSSADSGSGSSAVTEPQQPDTETPPDYYEEDYYYGDD